MASKFEELLVDLSRQTAGVERLLEAAMQQQKEFSRELSAVREKVARLEKGEEWSGEERRKVDQRLGTGDHTFERLKYEVTAAERNSSNAVEKAEQAVSVAKAVLKSVEELRQGAARVASRNSSRMWFVVKTVLQYAIPLAISGIGALVTFYYAKGGRP